MTTVRNKLNSLQGLAHRRTLGSLSTTPLVAMEVLTNTTPLDTTIIDIAIRTAHRLKCWNSWTENNYGHASIIMNEANAEMNDWMKMDQDRSAPSMVPQRSFQVKIPTREQWRQDEVLSRNQIEWYTDGSNRNGLAGAGWTNGTTERHYASLGRNVTVFQAEAYAITRCARLLMDKGTCSKDIRIFTDSQAVLLSVQKLMHTSVTARRCKEHLNELASRGNKVTLCWVPGHKGIAGNELADKLANMGSGRAPPEGVPRQVPLPEAAFALGRRRWSMEQRKRRWDSTVGCRVAKKMIGPDPIYKNWRDLMDLPREDTRRVAGLLTGHAILNHHLTRMGELQDEHCEFCDEYIAESAEHILTSCQGLMEPRFKRFRKAILDEEDVQQLTIKGIQKFAQDVDRTRPRNEDEEEEEEVW
ncbi:PREDICTED: uncharacterized protein LOC107187113 [Dufourea novaeangliae]|uniref:uncharacterized protein LOC107187113 n=1 Tax=Dufourea novaeangliae TaxID=178035 RepID=UPI000767A771|nr:PREDICTED: uncharacterized protein LOC107187113 [Dufourea novaeangliae]